MPAWVYREDGGYFVGECFGIVFYEDSIGMDLSEEERPIEFENVEEAIEYMNSWIVSDGLAFVTTTAPGDGSPKSIYQGPVKKMLQSWLAEYS